MDFVGKSCERVQSSFLEVIYSEHMALRQHILSQLIAFTKGKAVGKRDDWDILCTVSGDCINIASTLDNWTDLEAIVFS
jgi:hypothetical protein